MQPVSDSGATSTHDASGTAVTSLEVDDGVGASFDAFVSRDRREALALGITLPDPAWGAALFADLSGFTALTEALVQELGPQRGAEVLTATLDRVFVALIGELDRFGGHVVYFSGDAITCWLEGDDGMRATACALGMQAAVSRLAEVATPRGTSVRLGMKAAVAVGQARRFVVGDPDVQLIDVLAGRLIDALGTAERLAARGEVLLDASALGALGDCVDLAGMRMDPESAQAFGLVRRLKVDVHELPPSKPSAPLDDQVVRPWVLPVVRDRLGTGHDEFLAELRSAYPLFVHFSGIDFDNDPQAVPKLDGFIRRVQDTLTVLGGTLLHLTIGDKGAYLSAVFGAPLAHEDDALRACSAALQLRSVAASSDVTDVRIGLTLGRLRSGTCGVHHRRAFTCFGDAVNLAARLMSAAPPGSIYVSDSVRRTVGDAFTWQTLSAVKVKGKVEPIPVFALTGAPAKAGRTTTQAYLPMVGRVAELRTIQASLERAITGQGRIVSVTAEAGMGKSRLLAEVQTLAREHGVVVAAGECQSFGTNTGYFVWKDIWATLFDLDERMPVTERIRHVQSTLAEIDDDLALRAPLLAGLLDLPIADNELTASFDSKLRKISTESLLVECLRSRARRGPLLVVLEDCHWIDSLSRDLLVACARALVDFPVLVLLACRPNARADEALGVERLAHFVEVRLAELDAEETAALVRVKLAQWQSSGVSASTALVELVMARAQGNPFYIEELLNFIHSQGIAFDDAEAMRRLDLPESLQSLVLGRIDQLQEAPRRTLKVASVLGRTFGAATLPGVYSPLGTLSAVCEQLAVLESADLVAREHEGAMDFAFRHIVTQEVAYGSMPFGFREMLHERVGQYIEHSAGENLDRHLDLLAHHYWHSGNLPKKREYLARAGDAAQASYANAAAIDYFDRLASLLEPSERVETYLKLVKVLEIVGQWRRAEDSAQAALDLAAKAGDEHWSATCETALAEVARKQGRYDEASDRLERARRGFEALGETAGVGQVLHLLGTIAAQRGDYEHAVAKYEASLAIRELLDDKPSMAGLLSNLGVVAEYRGDNERARDLHERALALRTAIGDRRGLGVSTNCLGMVALLQNRFVEARDWFQRSIDLNRQIGDGWMVAICNDNLGNAFRGLGDYAGARRHYAESLRAHREYDDRWALAFLLEDIGVLAAHESDGFTALELLGAADAVREAIGAPCAPSREQEIDEFVAPSVASLGLEERSACRARGRALDIAAAIELAGRVLQRAQ